ncbi:MAG: hypothetical protein WB445_10570 [Acinetobacter sp.]
MADFSLMLHILVLLLRLFYILQIFKRRLEYCQFIKCDCAIQQRERRSKISQKDDPAFAAALYWPQWLQHSGGKMLIDFQLEQRKKI